MILKCPHCEKNADHLRSDFFGDWVVCPTCELPFAWKEAGNGRPGTVGNGNGTKVPETKAKAK